MSNYSLHTDLARQHPLDFTLQYPPRREYFQTQFKGPVNVSDILSAKEMLLYLHVPFCAAKCYFCNFAVDIRNAPELHRNYTNLLCEQIKRIDGLLPETTRVPGVDIGGGTPTLLQPEQLSQILDALKPWRRRMTNDHPISIETTPSIAANHPERLQALADGGVSRISMGVQSMNAETLASVNRSLQENMTEKAIANMRKAGFRRINIDVIFALPGQTEADWKSCIEQAIALDIDSITTYDCLYRGKGRALTKRTADKPSPEVYGALYDLSYNMLKDAGFHGHYGSVNFSRIAGETGTSPYFEGRLFDHTPYIGAGNYASSMVGNNWWFAPHATNAFMERITAGDTMPLGDVYYLPKNELMAKQALLSFNYGKIDTQKFAKRFDINFSDVYGTAVDYGMERGWLDKTETGYGVAAGQFKNMHLIRSLFYTPRAINWLENLETAERKKQA